MTVQTQPDWAADLIGLLDQQRGIYQQLHALSERQAGLVGNGDAEALLTLLGERQRLIDQLTQLNGRIEPFKRDWPRLWAQLDENSQAQVQNLIDKVQSLLDGIVQQDERDRAALSEHRDRIGAQIRQTQAGSAVNRAYGAPAAGAAGQARYTDRQG